MSLRKIFLNSFYYGIVPKISTLINILLLPVLTPYLTPYDYGIWGIVSSYSTMLLSLAPLGLNLHLTNSYFEYRNKWNLVWGRLLAFFLISGVVFFLISVLVIALELNNISWEKRFLIAIGGSIPILLFGHSLLASHLYPLKENPKVLVFRNLIASVSAILTSFFIIYVLKLGYWGFILSSAVAALVSFLLFIKPLYSRERILPIWHQKTRRLKAWILVSLPVIPHSLGFILLSSSSRIVMSWYKVPIKDIGLFSNGYLIGDYVTIVTTALVLALSPQLQLAFRNADYDKYRRLYYLCQITTLSASFCASFWMPEIYKLLIRNESLQECSEIARYICFANVLQPFYIFTSTIAFIEKKTKQLLWLLFLPAILNIILCLVLMPIYGYQTAIYTTLLAYWSQLLIPYVSSYYKGKTLLWLKSRYKIIFLLGILFVVLFCSSVLVQFSLFWKILITIMVILGYLLFLKFNKYDKII